MYQRQIFLPLIHEGVVMGLLVTGREDRSWNQRERDQIEQIARTLAIACILDQRRASGEQRLVQHLRLQAQQRDILDDLLHQFRNPLTALRTFGKLLLKRLRSGDANSEVATSIVRETDRLQELLQQFDLAIDMTEADIEPLMLTANYPSKGAATAPLMLPAANSASLELALESCSVAFVLEPLLISARAIAQERNLNLIAEISPDLPPVQANAKALREVLSNLIDNALKYTPAGGQIYIQVGTQRLKSEEVYQAIAISDTGAGIPPQDLEHIFERHYRGVQAESLIPGTGLGLAIAKELVEKMQGEIEVISPALSNWAAGGSPEARAACAAESGTTVVVWLPVWQ
jgi:signal transduction histidine kinase